MRLIRVTTAEQLTNKAKVTFAFLESGYNPQRTRRFTGVILRTADRPNVFFICSSCPDLDGGHPRETTAAGTPYAWAIRDTSSTPLVERLKGNYIYGLSLMVNDRLPPT